MTGPTTGPVTGAVDPDWIWWWRCRTCDIASGPTDSGPEALHLAAVHDHLHHRGQRTAAIRCVPTPTNDLAVRVAPGPYRGDRSLAVVFASGSVAVLAHDEHADLYLAPGAYAIRRQRQASPRPDLSVEMEVID